ncbi:hypothetical protein [Legionella pneumophila]|uniref:hypothetical protein n=1 Tax=Legionella pneumophila TaxID=446 RepID=UPI0038D04E80
MNFMSKDLQDAFNKAIPVLEKITEIKNQISKEISFLENSLKSFAINDNFSYFIQDPYNTTSFSNADIGEYCLSGTAITNEELLLWDKNKKRLIYQLNQYEAEVDLENPSPVTLIISSQKTILSKPLIETAFEIRKKVYEKQYLTKFLHDLTARYQVNLKSEPESSDIPF